MSKNEAEEAVSVVSLISNSEGYINEIQLEKSGLLIDKTSSIYLYVKLNDLASLIFVWLLSTIQEASTDEVSLIHYA